MSTITHSLRRVIFRSGAPRTVAVADDAPAAATQPQPGGLEIAPNDPIIGYFQSAVGAVDIDGLELDSPALDELRAAGVKLVVPLVTQGELIGLLNLGPRLSEQDYSGEDRRLLESLAAQAAPAVRVGQLVREQEAEVRSRERLDAELAVARLIQQNFLPRQVPQIARLGGGRRLPAGARGGRRLLRLHRPARRPARDRDRRRHRQGRAGGAGDGRHPQRAARLRPAPDRAGRGAGAGERTPLPRHPREHVRDLPLRRAGAGQRPAGVRQRRPQPAAGRARRRHQRAARAGDAAGADAGHELRGDRGRSSQPGAQLLLYSDGITEAHDPGREMFGGPRLAAAMAEVGDGDGGRLIGALLERLRAFTAAAAEQEDDITLVAIRRMPAAAELADFTARERARQRARGDRARLELALAGEGLEPARLERLKTAVAEATMNAMEHGNGFDPELPVRLTVLASAAEVRVCISDHGLGQGDLRTAPRARPRRQAGRRADAARLGPVPDPKHGRRAARAAATTTPTRWSWCCTETRGGSDGNHARGAGAGGAMASPPSPSPATSTAVPARRSTPPTPRRPARATLLLDFGDVAYINSTGIALIVGLLGRARADGVAVAACRLSDHYREIFEITRLSDFMSIHADERSARAATQGGAR